MVLYEDDGAHFRVEKTNDAPTITSNFYIMYGKLDAVMVAAPGAGIVSSLVLLSNTLDEIDWVCLLELRFPLKLELIFYDRSGLEVTLGRLSPIILEREIPRHMTVELFIQLTTKNTMTMVLNGLQSL